MSPVDQPIIEGGIIVDTTPPNIGLPPPSRRATASSHSTIHQLPIPVHTPSAPSGSTSGAPFDVRPPRTPSPGTPPLVADGETNSPIEEVAPTTPPAALNRTSVPESFGQKNDPPSYLTARLQYNVAALHGDVKALEKKVELYSAQSQADLAAGTANLHRSLGEMILNSEMRSRGVIQQFQDELSTEMKKVQEQVSEKFDLIFQVMSDLAKDVGERRLSGGADPASQGLPTARSDVSSAAGPENV